MKGIIFREFLDMVEDRFGDEIVDQIIEESNLPNDGAYTSVGTYPHEEMVQLVVSLSKATQIAAPTLLNVFGEHAFGRFALGYPHMFIGIDDAFSFLEEIQENIHVQVLKLYPEAQLPFIEIISRNEDQLEMLYTSDRKMADLALGLINGCLNHFNEKADIESEDVLDNKSKVKFIVKKRQ